LLERARAAGDRGRPAVAVALCRRALRLLGRDGGPRALRTRILVTLSFNLSESGDVQGALAALDESSSDLDQRPALTAARGVVLFRAGNAVQALPYLNQAVTGLAEGDRGDLAAALLNRGTALMTLGDLRGAQTDTAAAQRVASEAGLDVVAFMAAYNLGYIRFLAGDLPGSLQAMSAAEELAPEAALGVPALDRARVLLAAGLLGEAREYVDSSISTFTQNRAMTDLADALLVGADIAVMSGDPVRARALARRAARISARRGNTAAELLSRLVEQRAAAAVRRADRRAAAQAGSYRPVRPTRARGDAAAATELADALTAAGRKQDATAARLLAVEALLDAGDTAAAAAEFKPLESAARRLPLAGRLQGHLMGARIALDSGRRADGVRRLRRGLDDLAGFQALFGSQDLQAATAVWGRQLASAGLRAAAESGSPAAILQWLERSRATSTRLPHIRPPADPVLAADLGALRVADAAARTALLAGRPDPEREREVAELRRRVRARSWTLGGTGAALRPPSLSSVQRALAAGDSPTVLAFFHGAGHVHVLVITARSARYHRLAELTLCEELIRVCAADLELLAADRVPSALRRVADRSLRAALRELSGHLIEPVLGPGTGPVLVSGAGPLGAVPWSLLPALAGRPVSATNSVSAGLAGLAARGPAYRHGVLAVAGPRVDRGAEEAGVVAARYPGSVALTGGRATGDAVLRGIPAGGLLHIAAHGHHEPDNPLFSAVLLADGPLFAYDIAPNPALPDHVVLSSCDVGRTAVRGDGEPLGLATALLRSGVRTVIAAVAPVSDRAAAAVMAGYHDRLAAGDGPAAALAAALPLSGEAPAPFTCFGAGA
jgi:tetratricopeptide (TPR) repeat protein